MFKLLPKNKNPTEMLCFQIEHTLVIYVQFIISSKRKTSSLKEKPFKNDSKQHFETLKIDYSTSNQ